MPGLIESKKYTEQKEGICSGDPRLGAIIDSLEWDLEDAVEFDEYELVANSPPIRAHSRDGDIVVIFGFEEFDGETKVHLLEVWVSKSDDDDE